MIQCELSLLLNRYNANETVTFTCSYLNSIEIDLRKSKVNTSKCEFLQTK